jgi:uncharacterized protein (DUF2062 family)
MRSAPLRPRADPAALLPKYLKMIAILNRAPINDSLGERRAERALPRYGMLYFNHLCSEFYLLGKDALQPEHLKRLEELIEKKQRRERLTWDDLYLFDLALCRSMPVERLPQKVGTLRSRFRDVAGAQRYEAYLAMNPPEVTSSDSEVLRADVETLLSELYFRYAITPVREQQREVMAGRVAYALGACLLVSVALCIAATVITGDILNMLPVVVMFSGGIGGLVSMQQRYQGWSQEGDPMHNVAQLVRGWKFVLLPAMAGSVFAFLLFLVFASKLLEGVIFPGFKGLATKDLTSASITNVLPTVMDADFAKLLVWSFIAGFAERFVPDTLSRIIDRGEPESPLG